MFSRAARMALHVSPVNPRFGVTAGALRGETCHRRSTNETLAMKLWHTIVVCFLLVHSLALADNEREQKVIADKQQFDSKEDWIYNDLDRAYREASSAGKPIMAVMRCIPCEECVKLDDDLIDNDPAIASLMDKFVRVRLTGTNGLDLKTFQYDTDQSFAVI